MELVRGAEREVELVARVAGISSGLRVSCYSPWSVSAFKLQLLVAYSKEKSTEKYNGFRYTNLRVFLIRIILFPIYFFFLIIFFFSFFFSFSFQGVLIFFPFYLLFFILLFISLHSIPIRSPHSQFSSQL